MAKKQGRALTKNQRRVLDALKESKGQCWARSGPGAGWVYGNAHMTQQACEALVAAGHARREGEGTAARYFYVEKPLEPAAPAADQQVAA